MKTKIVDNSKAQKRRLQLDEKFEHNKKIQQLIYHVMKNVLQPLPPNLINRKDSKEISIRHYIKYKKFKNKTEEYQYYSSNNADDDRVRKI